MVKVPKEVIIQKIKDKAGLSDKEISTKIKDKMDLLSGLISEEGAAYIIANELGVKVYDEPGNLQVKNIVPGMRSVDISARVVKIYETRTFEKDNRKGKVGSFLAGDDTGLVRVTCWNDKADLLVALKEGQTVKIDRAYTKENNGRVELHLGDKGNITVTGEASAAGMPRENIQSVRKSIKELAGGEDNVEILGTIVQAFDPKFFEVCPECGKRVKPGEGGFVCQQHNIVSPTYGYVMNLMLDDGSENIRVVLWRNQVQKLLNMSDIDIVSKRGTNFEEQKNDLLGKIMKFVGRAQKNEMFQRIEFTANLVFTNPDPEEEMARLEKELEKVKTDEKKSTDASHDRFDEGDLGKDKDDGDDDDDDSDDDDSEEEMTIKDTKAKPVNKEKDDILGDIDDLSELDEL